MGMTTTQLALVRAIAEKDYKKAHNAAIACCAEDTTQKNHYAVTRYRSMLENTPQLLELPANLQGLLVLEDVTDTFHEDRYYLTAREASAAGRILRMQEAALALMEKRIPYLNATLLYGQPGTGKTVFGRYIAYRLHLPFAYINFSGIINSYMGSTSKNLSLIFNFVRTQQCVIMLDEIDCIGLARGSGTDGPSGELARTTITLMQELDTLTNEQLLLAATNRYDRLDAALKSRFPVHHEVLPLVSSDERAAFVKQFLNSVDVPYSDDDIAGYAAMEKPQRDIVTDMVQAIADSIATHTDFRLVKGDVS